MFKLTTIIHDFVRLTFCTVHENDTIRSDRELSDPIEAVYNQLK